MMPLLSALNSSHIVQAPQVPDFEQVNVCQEPMLWISIYPRAKHRHCSTVFFVNFQHILHLVLVFLLFI